MWKVVTRIDRSVENMSGKMDVVIMNQEKCNRSLMPHEKRIQRPHNLPSLSITELKTFHVFDKFLQEPANLSAAVCIYLTML